jgi:hypothetical protein
MATSNRVLESIYVPDMAVVFRGAEPPVLETVMPAANGMLSAESLATMYGALANGGVAGGRRLLSAETVNQLARVQTRAIDRNLLVPMTWRLGYHQAFVPGVWLPRAFGHFGYAGSGAGPTRCRARRSRSSPTGSTRSVPRSGTSRSRG